MGRGLAARGRARQLRRRPVEHPLRADGAELRFLAEAQRSRHDELLIVGSDYRAPFGSFTGELPGGIALAHGLGVVEHHRARW